MAASTGSPRNSKSSSSVSKQAKKPEGWALAPSRNCCVAAWSMVTGLGMPWLMGWFCTIWGQLASKIW